MSRNGSGTFSLTAGNPVVTGTTISSSVHNTTLADIASALSQSIAQDGQTAVTANLPMTGFRHINVANALNRNEYCTAGQSQDNTFDWLTSVSGSNTITAAAAIGMTLYAPGQVFRFIAAASNTGTATLNINGIGSKPVTKNGSTPLASGDISANALIVVAYDGSNFQLVSPIVVVTFVSGELKAVAFSTVPSGWMACDGAAVSRTTYAGLFAAIGTLWGVGDGSTTFNVPDFRGRTLIGAGTGPGLTARTLAQTIGEETHALTLAENAAHTHSVNDPGHYHQYTRSFTYNSGGGGGLANNPGADNTAAAVTGISITSSGSGTGHNNMQPSAVVSWIIKT